MPDLNPWQVSLRVHEGKRLRSVTAALPGWYAVYGWVDDSGEVQLDWEPVACWVVVRGLSRDVDDEVVPIVRHEGGPEFWLAVEPAMDLRPLGVHTEAERHDEQLLARLRSDARERHASELAARERRNAQAARVLAFVTAQPDPAQFAAQMRQLSTCTSLEDAAAAIDLSGGDPAMALRWASRRRRERFDELWRRREQQAAT
jgi:hypothetical protein